MPIPNDALQARKESLLKMIGEILVSETRRELAARRLVDSELFRRAEYRIEGEDTVVLVLPEYAKYVESGRAPGTKKVPIEVLLAFIKRRGIVTDNANALAFAIQTAIFQRGIAARPFREKAEKRAEMRITKLWNKQVEALAADIRKPILQLWQT